MVEFDTLNPNPKPKMKLLLSKLHRCERTLNSRSKGHGRPGRRESRATRVPGDGCLGNGLGQRIRGLYLGYSFGKIIRNPYSQAV